MSRSFNRKDIFIFMLAAAILVLAVLRFDRVWGFFGQLIGVLSPVILGLVLAFIVNLLMVKIEVRLWPNSEKKWPRRLRRPFAILFSLLIVLAVIALLLILVIPQLIDAGQTIVSAVPKWFEAAVDYLEGLTAQDPELVRQLEDRIVGQGEVLWKSIQNNAGSFGAGLLSTSIGVFNSLFDIVMGIIIAIYILADKENLGRQFSRLTDAYLPKKVGRKLRTTTEVAEDTFSSYVIGQSIDALVLGILCFIGMSLLRMPYAAMISTVVGFTNIVPIIGPYVGAVIGAFVLLTDEISTVIAFLVFVVIIQQIDGNFIMPRIVGGSVGLPALWVLVSIIVMGGLFGFLGVLIAVPVASTIYKLIGMHIRSRLDNQKKQAGPEMNVEADKILEERQSKKSLV